MLNWVPTSLVRDWLFNSDMLALETTGAIAEKLELVTLTGVLKLRGNTFIQIAMLDMVLLAVAFAPVM